MDLDATKIFITQDLLDRELLYLRRQHFRADHILKIIEKLNPKELIKANQAYLKIFYLWFLPFIVDNVAFPI